MIILQNLIVVHVTLFCNKILMICLFLAKIMLDNTYKNCRQCVKVNHMAIAPIKVSDISKTRRFVSSFATRSLLPLLMTEACVEAGRTYQAHKRGGFLEARERITEEFISAVIWFSGVPVFDKLIDSLIGKKILKLPEEGFSVGKDAARNPVANFIGEKFRGQDPKQVEELLGKFRFGKLVASLALATITVGVAVPKINQAITRAMRRKQKEQENTNTQNVPLPYNVDMESFLNGKSKDISFTGALSGAKLMNFVNTFETTPKYQLMTEDGGVLVGRGSNARNKYEAIEIVFRDGTSCYFYMFNTPVVAGLINKAMGGSRINPMSSEVATRHFIDMLNGGEMTAEAFKKAALGNKHLANRITPELSEILEKGGGRIEFEQFQRLFPDISAETVKKMSELQPKMFIDGVQKGILTKGQIENLFIGGRANAPEFLHDQYAVNTGEDFLKGAWRKAFHKSRPEPTPGYLDEFGYVKLKDLESSKKHVEDFVNDIVKAAKKKGQNVTKELIEKANKKVLWKQGIAWGTGFGVSILFLSTLIPKAQYWITRKLTGTDLFPGVTEYDKGKKVA